MGCSNEELNEKRRLGHSEVKFIEDSFFRIFLFYFNNNNNSKQIIVNHCLLEYMILRRLIFEKIQNRCRWSW